MLVTNLLQQRLRSGQVGQRFGVAMLIEVDQPQVILSVSQPRRVSQALE